MSQIELINPQAIRSQPKGKALSSGKDFDSWMSAMQGVEAMGPAAATAGQMYGTPNAQAVLASAFSGVSTTGAVAGQAAYPSFAGGAMGEYGVGAAKYGSTSTFGDPNAPVVPGTEGFTQAEMINTMNQNNLKLLELQAVLQSSMQVWNTKSNILSADHRARMAMIEKFTTR